MTSTMPSWSRSRRRASAVWAEAVRASPRSVASSSPPIGRSSTRATMRPLHGSPGSPRLREAPNPSPGRAASARSSVGLFLVRFLGRSPRCLTSLGVLRRARRAERRVHMPAQRDGLHEYPHAAADRKIELDARVRGDLRDEPRSAYVDLDEMGARRIGPETNERPLEAVPNGETARRLDCENQIASEQLHTHSPPRG